MKQQSSSLSLAIRSGITGIHNAFRAKLASYLAAVPNRTVPQASRINTNPNATWSQFQRTQLMFDGEYLVKSSDFGANYVQKRRMYCTSEATYAPDTGDAKRDEDLRAYLDSVWEKMSVNCSMLEAFSRTADVELPMRGDSALIWIRDESRMRLMEVQADRIGEIYNYYSNPEVVDGLNYFAGIYTYPTKSSQFAGEYAAFKVYERVDQWYGNAAVYPSTDVMFFKDDLMAGFRGVTKFAQCLPIVGNRDMILNATMQTMLQQSKVAAIASNNAGQPDEISYDAVNYNNGTVEYVERNGDGPVTRWQFNGDSYQVLKSEHPSTSFQLAIDRLDEKSALAIGFPYSFLYSSRDTGGAPSRFEFGIAGKEITRLRQNVYRPRLNIISYVTIMDAIERKIFRPSILKNKSSGRFENTLTRGNWNFGTLPTADAFRDDKSDVASVRAGTMTRNDVTTANSGRPYSVVLRQSAQEAIEQAKIVQDSNKQLKDEGYEGNLTKDDIAQISDNPQSAANAQDILMNGKTIGAGVPRKTAALSAYMGDVTVGDLPEDTRLEIERILGTNGSTNSLKVVKYGMVADELAGMADQHNLESAQKNLKYCTNGSCSDEVHAKTDKHILVNNGRIVDGHHYLARALKGKVTKSLHVIDLTPARFQIAKLSSFNEAQHPRDENGKWTDGFGSSGMFRGTPNKDALKADEYGVVYLTDDAESASHYAVRHNASNPTLTEFESNLKNTLDLTDDRNGPASGKRRLLDFLDDNLPKDSDFRSRIPEIRKEKEIVLHDLLRDGDTVSALKSSGYDSFKFTDDSGLKIHTTVGVLDKSILSIKKQKSKN